MTGAITSRLAAAALLTAAAVGCNGNHYPGAGGGEPHSADTPAAAARAEPSDTLMGVVAVVGAVPATRVALRTAAGTVPVTGSVTSALRRVVGVEVELVGDRGEGPFEASAFRVVAVDGMPAADGVLELDGDMAVLRSQAGGTVRYGPAPSALKSLVGQRVWIAGQRGDTPESWGLIGPTD